MPTLTALDIKPNSGTNDTIAITPRSFPSPRNHRTSTTISIGIELSWPTSAPPTTQDLPTLIVFLNAIRVLATSGSVYGIPALEQVVCELRKASDANNGIKYKLREVHEMTFRQALLANNGNRTHTAKDLGVSVRTVRNWLRKSKQSNDA